MAGKQGQEHYFDFIQQFEHKGQECYNETQTTELNLTDALAEPAL